VKIVILGEIDIPYSDYSRLMESEDRWFECVDEKVDVLYGELELKIRFKARNVSTYLSRNGHCFSHIFFGVNFF